MADRSSAEGGSRRRVALVLIALGVILGLGVLVVAAVSGDETERGSGPLAWSGDARTVTPSALPDDRVLSARLENTSLRRVRLEARAVRLVGADGRPVPAAATFASTFLHGLYPPTREPDRLPESELRRLGRLAVLEPRQSVPVTLAWRVEPGGAEPERVDYGQGTLPLPR